MFECRLLARAPIAVGLASAITATTVLRADSFTPIPKMHVARSGHQATLLDDGRVLVTGGSDDAGAAVGRAEIFNPVTRSWAEAGPNLYARVQHAATLLHDGRLVVVGGASTTSSCEPIPAAEIYDSRTGTWSLTRDLPIAFAHGPAAVRLADHQVLVSGGGTPCGSLSRSAAIFDPASNTWLPTSSMNVARQFHAAVLMGDGRVLVTGGALTQDGELVDAEGTTRRRANGRSCRVARYFWARRATGTSSRLPRCSTLRDPLFRGRPTAHVRPRRCCRVRDSLSQAEH